MAILELILVFILDYFYNLTSNYGLSLILLSAFVSLVLVPFYYLTGLLEKRERIIKQKLEPFIQKINSLKNSKIKHILLKELYWSFSYYPFYTLRSLAGLFIQIPMLFAAYGVLTKKQFNGESFLFINDLGKADFLLFGINLLPIIMTAINITSVLLSAKTGSAERRQGIFIAMIFLVLLYSQNSALLLYWTFNQFFNFVRYVFAFKTSNLTIPKITLTKMRNLIFPKPSLLNFTLAYSAMAFPAILIYKQNAVYFVGTDLLVYIAILFAISLLVILLFKHWIAVALILSFMFFPMLRETSRIVDSYGYVLSRILCAFLFLYFLHFFARQRMVLMVFFAIAVIYSVIFVKYETSKFVGPQIVLPQNLTEMKLKDSSSIYLFMHDAFPHRDIAEHLKLPQYNELMIFFEQSGFNIYDVYSLADYTLLTMYRLFQMTTDSLSNTSVSGDYLRYFVSGNNIANLLLQNKGYKTGVSNISNSWFFQKNNNAWSFWVNDKVGNNLLLKEVLKGESFHRVLSFIDLNLEFAEFTAKKNNQGKIFAWTTAGPGHARQSLNSSVEAEYNAWLPNYNKAVYEMKIEIESLVKNNPNAIIIFMSDHGPKLIDVPAFPLNYDFNKTDYMKFRDVFGAFMAVRWPNREKAEKYDHDFDITQDLFPIVFAYLFDSETPLKYKMKNTEVRLGPHRFDKGIFYRDFYKDEK